jgi:hypothetical protein
MVAWGSTPTLGVSRLGLIGVHRPMPSAPGRASGQPKGGLAEMAVSDELRLPGGKVTEPERQSQAGRKLSVTNWLLQDSPYILMLLLALGGMVFPVPIGYWLILTPVYGIICIVAGWRHFGTREAHLQLIYTQALSWGALILAIFVLYHNKNHGVLDSNASALTILTLLALGTFVAGVQARVWRTCVVGAILFLAVPGFGWLDDSVALLVMATLAIIGVGGLAWWFEQR